MPASVSAAAEWSAFHGCRTPALHCACKEATKKRHTFPSFLSGDEIKLLPLCLKEGHQEETCLSVLPV